MEVSSNLNDFIINALDVCKDFEGFSREELEEIASVCKLVEIKKGDRVFSVDHDGKYVFVVAQGILSLRLRNNKYKEFKKGDLFGEIGIFTNQGRLGTIKCEEPSALVAIDRDGILTPNSLSLELRHKIVLRFIRKTIGYFYDDYPVATRDLILKGECESIEFKESASGKSVDKIIRTSCAFMNLNGGSILIGVRDDGMIKGVEMDNQELDKYQRDLYNGIRQKVGQDLAPLVNFDMESLDDKLVIRIDVDSSKSPVFYSENYKGVEKEIFIVRTGSTNNNLVKTSRIIQFIQNNYKLDLD